MRDEKLNPMAILEDPASSHWLRSVLASAMMRDICDALADAEALVAALRYVEGLYSELNPS